MKLRQLFFVLYLATFLPVVLFAQDLNFVIEPVKSNAPEKIVLPVDELPDSTVVRRSIMNSHIFNPIEEVLQQGAKKITDELGNKFIVRSTVLNDKLAVYIVPTGATNKIPQGSWIIYRNLSSGAVTHAEIIIRADEPLILSFRPPHNKAQINKSYMDIRLFNTFIKKDYPLGTAFKLLLTDSLSDIIKLSRITNLQTLTQVHKLAGTVEECFNLIEKNRDQLVALKKGCFNAEGKAVYRDTNSPQKKSFFTNLLQKRQKLEEIKGGVDDAGFAKWIIDGIVASIAGQGVFIDSLKRPTTTVDSYFNKSASTYRNQFFALDWIRNLAAADISLRLRRTVYPDQAGLDVEVDPFAHAKSYDKTKKEFFGWQKNVGYQSEFLDALLYYLAVNEPNNFYLGAQSHEQGHPKLREYSDVYVFFPYFKNDGTFHIKIFNGIQQLSIEEFKAKTQKSFTFLVRTPAPEDGLFRPFF